MQLEFTTSFRYQQCHSVVAESQCCLPRELSHNIIVVVVMVEVKISRGKLILLNYFPVSAGVQQTRSDRS